MADKFSKKLEYKFKEFTKSLIVGNKSSQLVLNSKNELSDKIKAKKSLKILLLRNDRIGDVLISTPFIMALRELFPWAQIDILLSDKNKSIVSALEGIINDFYIYSKKIPLIISLIQKLKSNNYHLIIDLFDNPSTTSSFLIRLIKPEFSLGLDKENRNSYTHVVEKLDIHKNHVVNRLNNLLKVFSENDFSEKKLFYPINKSKISSDFIQKSKAIRLGINLAGSNRDKFWGLANNIEFINNILHKHSNIEIIIFGTKDYENEIQSIKQKCNVKISPLNLSFDEYANNISTCDIILTPDTAAIHLASAFGIPCIALYRVDNGKSGLVWGPYKIPNQIITTNSPNLSAIEVDDVISSFNLLLKESIA